MRDQRKARGVCHKKQLLPSASAPQVALLETVHILYRQYPKMVFTSDWHTYLSAGRPSDGSSYGAPVQVCGTFIAPAGSTV